MSCQLDWPTLHGNRHPQYCHSAIAKQCAGVEGEHINAPRWWMFSNAGQNMYKADACPN